MNTKLIVLLVALAFSTNVASAQTHKRVIKPVKKVEEPKEEPEEEVKLGEKVFVSVETLPSFPGGLEELNKFIKKNLDLNKGKANSRVNVTFVVEKDGSLSDIQKIGRTDDVKTDEEAIRVMKLSPKWAPGIHNGHAVRTQYTVPVAFKSE
jgi:TonB family protein